MIAKKSGNALRTELHAPRFVEPVGVGGNPVAIAEKADVERAAEDSFVGTKPFESFFSCDGEGLIRDGAFGRPQPGGLHSKNLFVILARKLQLLASVFRAAEGPPRKRRGGIGHARNVRIANQGKDRMIERG